MTAPTKRDLAKMLAEMPYGPMLELAQELLDMNQEEENNRHPETAAGMAKTLYDWGEAYSQ